MRGMRIPTSTYIAVWLALLITARVWAHGGEDHGGESLATTSSTVRSPLIVPIETQILVEIRTAPVIRESLPKSITVLGRTMLRPEAEAVITSPVEGRLVMSEDYAPPSLGQHVSKGQPLAIVEQTISAPETIALGSERVSVESELRQAKADLDFAVKEFERVEKLKGIVPDKEILQATNALAVARAKYQGLTKKASVFESALAPTAPRTANPRLVTVRAPIDGVVAQTHVTIGEYVRPEKLLYHVVDLSDVLLEADVFEDDLASVSHAKSARAIVEAYSDDSFDATFVSIGTSVDPLTRALHILFSVPNPTGKLVAEMFATVIIDTGEQSDGITVPKDAIITQEGQSVVYVKTSGEQFVAWPVTIIQKFKDRVMLKDEPNSPMQEGGRVVIQGMYQVRMSAAKGASTPVSGNKR